MSKSPNTSEAQTPAGGRRRAWFGLARRKEVWVLTWRARLLLCVLLGGAGLLVVFGAHSFLAVEAPVPTRALVIEGWVPRYALTGYVARVWGDYSDIYTTGGPTLADHHSKDVSDTFASVAQWRLMRAGVPATNIHVVPCWEAQRDRTYSTAVALRNWAASNHVHLTSFNVVTLGPHARRSRLLYEKAFGPGVQVGVIPLVNEEYEADSWWRYSEGVKEVLSEGAAYLYSRFWFSAE